ncbi:MAG: DUF1223 domain-containing protein [Planctomycetes bacterium]|nr:DUF1223 domain-containing protein [Planctomycetota bacterium]
MSRILATLLLLIASLTPLSAGERLSVIELFTSQGCSSCPSADRLLGELSKRKDVLALSLPVDYWDYIGWKDTLASPAFSARQRAYAHARGDRAVYTPQAVVNGLVHRVGSDRKALSDALRETNAKRPTVPVDVSMNGDKIAVRIGDGRPGSRASVLLVLFDPSETVSIKRGENAGRTITYHNVVRRIVRIGAWTGEAQSFTVPKPSDGRRCAILVQAGAQDEPGAILGAAVM